VRRTIPEFDTDAIGSRDPLLSSGNRLVSAKVASMFLGCSPRSLRRLRVKLGLVPVRLGRRCLYRESDLRAVAGNLYAPETSEMEK